MKKIIFLAPALLLFCSFYKLMSHAEIETVLVDGNWIQSSYLIDKNNDGIFEDASLPCEVGDMWKFTADHKVEIRDEMAYCDSDVDTVAIITGIWELRNNDTELYVEFDPDFFYYNFHIQFVNALKMELRLYNTSEMYAPAEERFLFSK